MDITNKHGLVAMVSDNFIARIVCMLAAFSWCHQSELASGPDSQMSSAAKAQEAAHVVVGLFKSYNYTFEVLRERAKVLLSEATNNLERCQQMGTNISNLAHQSAARDVQSAVESALSSARTAKSDAHNLLGAALAALDNISRIAQFSTSFAVSDSDRQRVTNRELEMIEKPFFLASLMRSDCGSWAYFKNNSHHVLRNVYEEGERSATIDEHCVNEWVVKVSELWRSALNTSESEVEAFFEPVVRDRMTQLLKELKEEKMLLWWKVDKDRWRLIRDQIAAFKRLLRNLTDAALEHLRHTSAQLRNALSSLRTSESLEDVAARKMLSAKRGAACRATWRLASAEQSIRALRHSFSDVTTISHGLERLDHLQNLLMSVKQKTEDIQEHSAQVKQAGQSSIARSEKAQITLGLDEKVTTAVESSLAAAKKAAEFVTVDGATLENATVEVDEASVSLKEAQSTYSAAKGTQSRMNEILVIADANLTSLSKKLGAFLSTVDHSAPETRYDRCEGVGAAETNYHDDQLLWALDLFEGDAIVRSQLCDLMRGISQLEDTDSFLKVQIKAASERAESAARHIEASAKYVERVSNDMHTVEVGTARAHEQLNNASLSASREKRSVTCKLVAQLRGVQTDLVSLRKEALGLANDTSEAHVSQSPVMQMSGAEQSVADGVAVVAAGVLKDIEENLDFIKHSVNSPAKEVNIHPVNFSECTDKRGSITKDSVMGAVVQYFQLVGSNSTSHTKEALRKALNRWLRLRKASAKLVPRVVSVPLHESDAHGKASEVHKNTVYFEDVDRSPKRSETSHDGNETSTDVMGGVPFQAPKSSSTLMWLVMLISPLLLLVVLLSVILLRYRTQKKLDTQKNVKFPSIAHSRAGSFERFSYVPSEAENDSFAKMSEIELNMAPTW